MAKVELLKQRYYSDDFTDGTLIFYKWVRQHARPHHIVLNVGAGPTADRKVRSLRREVKQVTGVDVDDTVVHNTDLDQALVIQNGRLPFPDNYFDLAWADYVLEHVQEPVTVLKEIQRVLKLDASFFFRTPNKYHYVSIIGHITPHRLHELCAIEFVDYPTAVTNHIRHTILLTTGETLKK